MGERAPAFSADGLYLEQVPLGRAQALVGRRPEVVAEYCLLFLVPADVGGVQGAARLVCAVLGTAMPEVAVADNSRAGRAQDQDFVGVGLAGVRLAKGRLLAERFADNSCVRA